MAARVEAEPSEPAARPATNAARTDLHGDSLPDGAIARGGTVRFRHWRDIYCLAVSPDGKLLASGGWDRTVRVWDAGSGNQLRQFTGNPDSPVSAIAFSPDNKRIVAGDWNGGLRLWDSATGTLESQFIGHRTKIKAIVFAADGKVLASADETTARLWDVANATLLRRLPDAPKENPTWEAAFSADLRLLALGQRDGSVQLLDVASGRKLHQFQVHRGWIGSLSFSPDGGLLASAGRDAPYPKDRAEQANEKPLENYIYLWDMATGKQLRRLGPHLGSIHSVAFSRDSKTLVSNGSDYGIGRLWDVGTGKELARYGETADRLYRMTFSPNGKTLVAWGGCIRLWDVATRKESLSFASHSSGVEFVTFAPDGRSLVSGSQDYSIRFWNPATGRETRPPLRQSDNVLAIGFLDKKRMFTGSSDKNIRLWDLDLDRLIRRWQGSDESCVNTLALSPDGKTLASGSWDGHMSRWDTATGKRLTISDKLEGFVRVVAFSPDGKVLASGSNVVTLWDPVTGRRLRDLAKPSTDSEMECQGLVFSPDGRCLAVGGGSSGFWLMDVAVGNGSHSVGKGRPAEARAVAFSPDGRMLACGWGDGVVELYEVATGLLRRQFQGHQGYVNSLSFAPCGRMLASGADDALVLTWDVFATPSDRPRANTPLTANRLKGLFEKELASTDQSAVYLAICDLIKEPARAVAGLKDCLRPAPKIEPGQIASRVAELNHEQFAVREGASCELERLGEAAVPELRKALAGKPTLEMRRRVEDLLKKLEGWPMSSPETLRVLRALEVLEDIGSAEAIQVLQSLAGGASEARQTQAAKASLDRLSRRPGANPGGVRRSSPARWSRRDHFPTA